VHEIARLMERNGIKRVPVLQNKKVVGIVSRANLIQAVATKRPSLTVAGADESVRAEILQRLQREDWAGSAVLNATVHGGIVDLWGFVQSESERTAARVLAESTPGVQSVVDNIVVRPMFAGI
jgi:osmotically-inducible protein OsmY